MNIIDIPALGIGSSSSEIWAVVIGTVLGFGLSTGYAEVRSWRAESKRATAVRRMLMTEIDQNLALAKALQHRLASAEEEEGSDERGRRNARAYALTRDPFLAWSTCVYESHLFALPDALRRPDVDLVMRHYGFIATARETRGMLLRLSDEQQRAWLAPEGKRMMMPDSPFFRHAASIMENFDRELTATVLLGNPVNP